MNKFKHSSFTPAPLNQNAQHKLAMQQSMMIYPANALYTFIPKNACSTMRLSVAYANGCIDSENDINWIHGNNQTFRPTLGEAVKADYTFTFLRCPYKRIASVFLDKFVRKEPESWLYRDRLARNVELDDLTFSDFVHSLKKPGILRHNIHWRPQIDFLLYENYSRYFCLEKFSEAQDTLNSEIGFTMLDARSLTKHGLDQYEALDTGYFGDVCSFELSIMKRNGKCPTYASMYNENLFQTVTNLYKDDIEFYRAKFGNSGILKFDSNQ